MVTDLDTSYKRDRVRVIESGHYITLRIDGSTEGEHDFAPSNRVMFAEIHISDKELFRLGAQIAAVLKHRIRCLEFDRGELTEILAMATGND